MTFNEAYQQYIDESDPDYHTSMEALFQWFYEKGAEQSAREIVIVRCRIGGKELKNHHWQCDAKVGLDCTCDAPEELCPACQPCPICGNDNEHHAPSFPNGTIRTTGTVGQDLLTGVLFVTSEAIQGNFKRLDEVEIIILPKAR